LFSVYIPTASIGRGYSNEYFAQDELLND